jgi:hypothetical protein
VDQPRPQPFNLFLSLGIKPAARRFSTLVETANKGAPLVCQWGLWVTFIWKLRQSGTHRFPAEARGGINGKGMNDGEDIHRRVEVKGKGGGREGGREGGEGQGETILRISLTSSSSGLFGIFIFLRWSFLIGRWMLCTRRFNA